MAPQLLELSLLVARHHLESKLIPRKIELLTQTLHSRPTVATEDAQGQIVCAQPLQCCRGIRTQLIFDENHTEDAVRFRYGHPGRASSQGLVNGKPRRIPEQTFGLQPFRTAHANRG